MICAVGSRLEVADQEDRAVLRPVEALVEGADRLAVEGVARALHADRDAGGQARAAEHLVDRLHEDAPAGRVALALLAVDDAALLVHLAVGEQESVADVAHDGEAVGDHRLVRSAVELVDRPAEVGARAGVGAERGPPVAATDQLAGRDLLLPERPCGECLRARLLLRGFRRSCMRR
jgi:hypothetical protein